MSAPNDFHNMKTALQAGQRLLDYKSYGNDQAQAVRALARRCPGIDRTECQQMLNRAIEIHQSCLEFLRQHHREVWDYWQENSNGSSLEPMASALLNEFDDWPKEIVIQHLHFVFYVHYLR